MPQRGPEFGPEFDNVGSPSQANQDEDARERSVQEKDTRLDAAVLRSVATYQKGIISCIPSNLIAGAMLFIVAPEWRLVLVLVVAVLAIVPTVLVFLLAMKVYTPGAGVLLALLTLIPGVGLIILLGINSKATYLLRRHGIKVGFLGANASDIQ
jgi:hypothetical protein